MAHVGEKLCLRPRCRRSVPALEVPDMVMVGKNVSADNSTKLVVFQVGDAGKPMLIKAK